MLDAALHRPGRDRRSARRRRPAGRATRSSSRPTRSTARSPGSPARSCELAPAPVAGERVLVALSGGVDSAVAALRERERGAEVVAVTLKLWADRRTDAERSCCSPRRRARRPPARPRARDPAPHARPRAAVPRAGRRRLRRRLPGGADPEPLRRLQRRAADRRDDRARRAARLRGARHRPLRADRRRRRGAAAARRRRPGQGPVLHALRARARVARPAALPPRRAEQAARCASSPPAPASRSRTRPRARTSASSPARASARSSPATAASTSGRARSSTAPGAPVGRHRGHHGFTVGQRRGLGGGGPEPRYVLATDADDEHGRRRLARGARHAAG